MSTSRSAIAVAVVSWLIVLWILFIFLGSLPYKFTLHPDTQHIFGTIGAWLGGFLGDGIGNAFASFGPYLVGGFELLTSLVLLAPAIAWLINRVRGGTAGRGRAFWHALGGLMATAVVCGAVFGRAMGGPRPVSGNDKSLHKSTHQGFDVILTMQL